MSKRRTSRPAGRRPAETARPPRTPGPAHGTATPERGWHAWAAAAAIVVAVVVAYAGSLDGAFLFDDMGHIKNNDRIRDLWPISGYLDGRSRPLVHFSLAVNYAIGELDPSGYHVFNVGVHLAAALLLFGVVRRTLRSPRFDLGPATTWIAMAVALLWAVHPLQTQSVTYVIQRAESMMGLFYLLTLYCVVRGADAPRGRWWYVGAVAACGVGMASKGVMVTAPVVVLLYDRFFLATSFREVVRRRWGLHLGLFATWSILFALGLVVGVLDPDRAGARTVGLSIRGITWAEYLGTQPGVVLHYLKLSLWPRALCLDYLWPVARGAGAILPPLLALLAVVAMAAWGFLRYPWVGFVSLWFALILLPTSSFIPIKDLAVEHRMYLPLAAVVVLVVAGGWHALGRLVAAGHLPADRKGLVAFGALALVSMTLVTLTIRRNGVYRTDVLMWSDVIASRPGNVRAHANLGNAYDSRKQHEEAIAAYEAALAIAPVPPISHRDPAYVSSNYNLGIALFNRGRMPEAVECYRRAVELNPRHAKAHANLGTTLVRLGRPEAALDHFVQAVTIRPRFVEAHAGYGAALARLDRLEESEAALRRALVLRPEYAIAMRDLGAVLGKQGRIDEAIDQLRHAARLNSGDAMTHLNLGSALRADGRLDEAIAAFREGVRRAPRNETARRLLDEALAEKGAP